MAAAHLRCCAGVRAYYDTITSSVQPLVSPLLSFTLSQSIDALCDAIDEFTGGVVVISHDAQLLSRLCADEEHAEVWVVEDGRIRTYDGDFEDYRNELIKEITAELDADD